MRKITLRQLVTSASIWVSLISGILAILAYLTEKPLETIIWILIIPLIFLIVRIFIFYYQLQEQKEETKNLYETYDYAHDSVHKFRDELSGKKFSDLLIGFASKNIDKNVLDEHFNNLLSDILANITNTFRRLLGIECVSNIMVFNETNKMLETWLYCSNATEERMKNSSQLPRDHGLGGMVFNRGNQVEYNNDYANPKGNFSKVRDGYDRFYTAGMSAPINIDGKRHGVLNVDIKTKKKNAFKDEHKSTLSLYSDLLSATLQTYNLVIELDASMEVQENA